jgi:membrane protein DedA with SNARE-associated domain
VVGFVGAGALFGNLPFIKDNFSKVILVIIVVSVLPIFIEWWKARREAKHEAKHEAMREAEEAAKPPTGSTAESTTPKE